jgi:GNAT superfamily N-acetyltransferase
MFEEAAHPWKLTDASHMIERWTSLVSAGVGRAYGLWDPEICGILLGLIFPDSFCGVRQGYECLWTVQKAKRRQGLAKGLLQAFEEDCRTAGCAAVIGSAQCGPFVGRMREIYSKAGYEPTAEAFLKKL